MDISRDGEWLITGGEDGSICVFSIRTGDAQAALNRVRDTQFSEEVLVPVGELREKVSLFLEAHVCLCAKHAVFGVFASIAFATTNTSSITFFPPAPIVLACSLAQHRRSRKPEGNTLLALLCACSLLC